MFFNVILFSCMEVLLRQLLVHDTQFLNQIPKKVLWLQQQNQHEMLDEDMRFMNNWSPWKIIALLRFFQSFDKFRTQEICEK